MEKEIKDYIVKCAEAQLAQELNVGADARDYGILAGVLSDLVERITGENPNFPRTVSAVALGGVIKAKLVINKELI
jgi:hypothetical protein